MSEALVVGSGGWVGGAVSAELGRRGIPWRSASRVWSSTLVSRGGPGEIGPAILSSGVTCVINCAAPGETTQKQEGYVALTAALAAVCEELGVKLIHVGSAAEFGSNPMEFIADDAEPNPVSRYGEVKVAASELASSRGALVVRPFNIVGAQQPAGTPVGDWIRQIGRTGEDGGFVTVGNPSLVRDYVGLARVARVLSSLVERPEVTGFLNICSGEPNSFGSMCEALIRASGRAADMIAGSVAGVPRVVGDSQRLRDLGLYEVQNLGSLAAEALSTTALESR